MKLQFIHCKKCKKEYLVGINEKDLTKSKTSGGKNHLAIGNDQIDKAPKIEKFVNCKNCGNKCRVENAEEVKKWKQ